MNQLKNNLKTISSKLMICAGALCLMISLNSCLKDLFPKEEERIEIPGLGDTEGNLTGKPFTLPDGVVLEGDITGSARQSYYWQVSSLGITEPWKISKSGKEIKDIPVTTRAGNDPEIIYRGSGYSGYVNLLLKLRNTRSTPVEVTIPAATIFISKAGDCQNGVLIKLVKFTIPANSLYHLCLVLYCGNLSKNTASSSDIYILGVVSDAKPLLDLCDRVKNKKINIEEFSRSNSNDKTVYSNQVSELQDIVWHVTDHYGRLTDEDKRYINSLPNSN